ncbi:hypothetical protein ACFL0Q_09885, partial [Thermodesulfobacteriota bacterium]
PVYPEFAREIGRRRICIARNCVNNRPIFEGMDLAEVISWIKLNYLHGIGWDILERLQKKFREDLEKFAYWPRPDGIRYSEKSIQYEKQRLTSCFCSFLLRVIGGIEHGLLWVRDFNPASDEIKVPLDERYDSFGEFVDDFLKGACAFVPEVTNEFFVHKF